jgi:uncharacterized protein (TIGR00369 family)
VAPPEERGFGSGFSGLCGIELVEASGDEVRARIAVRDDLKQPLGFVHGGVLATLAETMTSAATWWAVGHEGKLVAGQSNSTSFLRPITGGNINGVARPRHRGATTWVWDVEISDDQGRLCALNRTAVAVRDLPGADDQPR